MQELENDLHNIDMFNKTNKEYSDAFKIIQVKGLNDNQFDTSPKSSKEAWTQIELPSSQQKATLTDP